MWEMDYDQAAAVWTNKDKDSVHMEKADLKKEGFASRQHME